MQHLFIIASAKFVGARRKVVAMVFECTLAFDVRCWLATSSTALQCAYHICPRIALSFLRPKATLRKSNQPKLSATVLFLYQPCIHIHYLVLFSTTQQPSWRRDHDTIFRALPSISFALLASHKSISYLHIDCRWDQLAEKGKVQPRLLYCRTSRVGSRRLDPDMQEQSSLCMISTRWCATERICTELYLMYPA